MLEKQLIDKCKAGDGEAFRELINVYRNKLYGYLWRFSESKFIAEELFQETLIKAWKGMRKYNHQKKFSSWLFTIAHNVAMDNLRSKKRDHNTNSFSDSDAGMVMVTPEEMLIKKETVELINNSITNLSEKQRRVFLLRQNGEMSFREIAETMNEPLNTILSHMRYAVRKIKKQVDNENEPRKQAAL
jgi:RNA polymerase sigma-70 factor (ECF subfamily)